MVNVYEAQTRNKIKSAIVVAFFVAFVFLATYVLTNALGNYWGYQPGVLGFFGLATIISGTSGFLSYYFSDKVILTISGAFSADRKKFFNFYTVSENLAIGMGLPKPKLYVIPDSAPNAFATGRSPDHAVVCATTGLLEKLNRTELEGVIAHELTHIKNYDTRLQSVVVVMVGLVALLGDWVLRANWFGGRRRENEEMGRFGALMLVIGIIFAALSPIVAQLIQLAISRRREFIADAGSVLITKQPDGLISALKKISQDPEPLEVANKATAHLFIVNPIKGNGYGSVAWLAGLFNTHPPVAERIKALQNMI